MYKKLKISSISAIAFCAFSFTYGVQNENFFSLTDAKNDAKPKDYLLELKKKRDTTISYNPRIKLPFYEFEDELVDTFVLEFNEQKYEKEKAAPINEASTLHLSPYEKMQCYYEAMIKINEILGVIEQKQKNSAIFTKTKRKFSFQQLQKLYQENAEYILNIHLPVELIVVHPDGNKTVEWREVDQFKS